jgi:hypothetical protein
MKRALLVGSACVLMGAGVGGGSTPTLLSGKPVSVRGIIT